MLANYVALFIFIAAAIAVNCTTDQLTAHGLTGQKQTVLSSRLEENQDDTFSVFEKREGEGGFICTVASDIVCPSGVPERRSDNRLFAGCKSRRDDTHSIPLAFRARVCPCVGKTCDAGRDCKATGCNGGCGCVYESGPPEDPTGLVCAYSLIQATAGAIESTDEVPPDGMQFPMESG
ncbi:hypothetical protein BOTBODRAFT_40940 [Botryobasidium botryosum FD-172 SS1]|uniref:Uncharacterized protein n=1 Tax=Botryobasidium botryosum (strain FD-172 SS1) TaxID=930990 RepID=A0A067NAX8_BOTB1|nr:hypothetical protein BOTBODRAFT_40940 [Botryobasidium botryosum FD-172 SS1]